MAIKKRYIAIGLIWTTVSVICAQPVRDSLSVSPQWHHLHNYQLSDNGKWAMIYKTYPQNSDTIYVINTNTKEKKVFTTENNIEFVNDFMISIDRKESAVVKTFDLNNGKFYAFENIKKHTILKEKDAVVYLNGKSNTLFIDKLSHSKRLKNLEMTKVKDYYISDSQSYLLILEENCKISILDLDKNEFVFKDSHLENIEQVIWNESNKQILTVGKNINLLDWNLKSSVTILEREDANKAVNIKAQFLNKESVYIQYAVDTGIPNEYSDYLDIWNGNDRKLEAKAFLKAGNIYEQESFIFEIQSKKRKRIPEQEKLSHPIALSATHILFQDRLKHRDYTTYAPAIDFYLYNTKSDSLILIADSIANTLSHFSYSIDGKYLSFKKNNVWSIIDVNSNKVFTVSQKIKDQGNIIWSKDNTIAYMIGDSNLWRIDLRTKKTKNITKFKNPDLEIDILNSKTYKDVVLIPDINFRYFVDNNRPIILHTANSQNNNNAIYKVEKNGNVTTVKQSPNRITEVKWSKNYETIVFCEENYNMPKTVNIFHKNHYANLLRSDIPIQLYSWRKQKIINYTDKNGTDLKGILYYPKNFCPNKKYPMITHIYQKQYSSANHFYQPSFKNATGFNIALLTESGYFVFLPDIVVSDEGPGISALNCVTQAIESITKSESSVNTHKLGLIGQSHGGYETNFIITQTNLFAAAVSGAGNSDIIRSYFSYNYNFRSPFFWQYENGQYQMNVPFSKDKEFYLKNSPILYVNQTTTPLLSWTGMNDENIHWEQTREFYIGLKRNKVPHIALFYKKEWHSFTFQKEQKDLTSRILDWFDYYLKDKKNIEWISKGVDYTTY